MATTINAVEEALAARIEALDAAPFQHRSEVWAETDIPLTQRPADSALEAHLAFSVTSETAPVRDDGHASEDQLTVMARFTVLFLYRLRSDDQRRDSRTAIEAARQVMGAIMAPSSVWGSAFPVNIYEPQAMEGEFLPVQLTFDLTFDVAIP